MLTILPKIYRVFRFHVGFIENPKMQTFTSLTSSCIYFLLLLLCLHLRHLFILISTFFFLSTNLSVSVFCLLSATLYLLCISCLFLSSLSSSPCLLSFSQSPLSSSPCPVSFSLSPMSFLSRHLLCRFHLLLLFYL
jgi:hypothetical protein